MKSCLLFFVLLGAPLAAQTAPVDARVRDLLGRMSIEEKFWQLYMIPGDPLTERDADYSHGIFGLQLDRDSVTDARSDAEHANAVQRWFAERTRLGIPVLLFEEALHGLQRPGATAFPQAIALAATFDTSLMSGVAGAIAREARSRGIRFVLSPVVNLATDVRWGRTEETYGEDPFLASLMGASYAGAMAAAGIVPTPKHLVANVGEGGRDSYPIEVSQRLLEELHFPPFEAAIRAAPLSSVMTAYNSVDGTPATQSRALITDQLRTRWGFTGFVISDAAATGGATVLHMTEPDTPTAAMHAWQAGLDVVFQSEWRQHRGYREAIVRGMVAESIVDAAVARVLRAKFALGLFDRREVDPDSARYWNGHAAHRALALEAARKSIVLLANNGILPIPASAAVAVIGADAAGARLGGYSGAGNDVVSILAGLRSLGESVRYAPGVSRVDSAVLAIPATMLSSDSSGRSVPGLAAEYFDNITLAGAPRVTRRDARVDFGWTLSGPARGLSNEWYSARWRGRVTLPVAARIGVEGSDGWRMWIDGVLVIDNRRKQTSRRVMTRVPVSAGAHRLQLEFFETTGNAHVRLVHEAAETWRAGLDSAVAVARGAGVAVIVAGIEEGEFRDRSRLGLPGHQEQLIEAVAATGTPVVVVLVGGSAITMPWLDRVAAVVDAWYPGEAGGTAVAEVLFGMANPGGRLPITFPVAEGQLPLRYNHKPTGRGDDYLDLTGQPLFPFGFGLSYTTFEYSDLRIAPFVAGVTTVRLRVRNTGQRDGDEVVQLYVRDVIASVARPVMELKGFQRVHLAAGASTEVAFTLGAAELSMLDASLRRVIEPGVFRVMVGASSRDIRLRGDLTIRP